MYFYNGVGMYFVHNGVSMYTYNKVPMYSNQVQCAHVLHPGTVCVFMYFAQVEFSAAKPYPRAEPHNYSERNGGAGSSKLGAHAHQNYHIILFHPHNYHIITFDHI